MDPVDVVSEHVRVTTEESDRVAATIPSEMRVQIPGDVSLGDP
jgi:hypothetical protein